MFTGLHARPGTNLHDYVFRCHAGLDEPYAGGVVWNSDTTMYVPIAVGEWIVKTHNNVFIVVDHHELQKTYEEE